MSKRSRSYSSSPLIDQSPLETWSKSPSPTRQATTTAAAGSSPRSKQLHLQEMGRPPVEVMRCSLPPHRETLSFPSYADYEVHYRQAHVNRCVECGKNFPTDRFLDLHIEENHDPLTAARRERGEKTYGCFIEDCERKCSTPQKRRLHLIDKHMFPRTYNFFIVNDGIDKQISMLRPLNPNNRRRLSHTPASPPKEGRLRNRQTSVSHQGTTTTTNNNNDASLPPPQTQANSGPENGADKMDIVELEKSMSALRFVPTSVTRNRGKGANQS